MSRKQLLLWAVPAWIIAAFLVQAIRWWMGGAPNWLEAFSSSTMSTGVILSLYFAGVARPDSTEFRDRFEHKIREYRHFLGGYSESDRVLANLEADMLGEPLNAGTPSKVRFDNCTISGLREQVRYINERRESAILSRRTKSFREHS